MDNIRCPPNTATPLHNSICLRLDTPALKGHEKLLLLVQLIFLSRFLGILPLLYDNSNTLYFTPTKLQWRPAT